MTAEIERAKEVRRILERICKKLLRPTVEALDSCADELKVAIGRLEQMEQSLISGRRGPGWHNLEREMMSVRRELGHVNALMIGAGRFHAGWARLLSNVDDAQANYTPQGKACEPIPIDRGKVVMHG